MRDTMEYEEPRDLNGTGILMDRNEVLEVYKTWRTLFNSYDPPRVAVAEAYVPADRLALYASADELGQAFNFELLKN